MTNLMRWLMYLGLFAAAYFAIITETIQSRALQRWMFEIQILPIIIAILAGLYAVCTVLYRTFTFNDCNEAGEELLRQIKEARQDLTAKGFKFRE